MPEPMVTTLALASKRGATPLAVAARAPLGVPTDPTRHQTLRAPDAFVRLSASTTQPNGGRLLDFDSDPLLDRRRYVRAIPCAPFTLR